MARKKPRPAAMPPGRPAEPHSTGSGAPQVTIRLDAQAEAAVAALRSQWATQEGPAPAAHALKRAAVDRAQSDCPEAYERALQVILRRRERDAR
jgi:hypothetical protein